jgi:NADH:ubiquinone oxidoreductase subunit H
MLELYQYIDFDGYRDIIDYTYLEWYLAYPDNNLIEGLLNCLTIGIKSCVMIFIFIWARASLPRIRFDQLMSFCWTVLLPIVIAFIILVPCILYSFEIIASNVSLLFVIFSIKPRYFGTKRSHDESDLNNDKRQKIEEDSAPES